MKLLFVSLLLFSLTLSMAAIMDMLALKISLPDSLSYMWQAISGKEYALSSLFTLTFIYLVFKTWYRAS